MISRTMAPLIVSYLLLIGAGFLFLQAPPPTLQDSTYGELLIVWALLYVIGPVLSLSSVTARYFLRIKHITALWHFEIAGLSLIVTANLVYSYALLRTGLSLGELNLVAFSLVISAFASSFIGRIVDVMKLVKAVNNVTPSGRTAK